MIEQPNNQEKADKYWDRPEDIYDSLRQVCAVKPGRLPKTIPNKDQVAPAFESLPVIKYEFDEETLKASEWLDFTDYDAGNSKGGFSRIRIISFSKWQKKEQATTYNQFVQVARSYQTGVTLELGYLETEEDGFGLDEMILHHGQRDFGPDAPETLDFLDQLADWLKDWQELIAPDELS